MGLVVRFLAVGGVSLKLEPSGFAVHLISLTNNSKTSDRGALSRALSPASAGNLCSFWSTLLPFQC